MNKTRKTCGATISNYAVIPYWFASKKVVASECIKRDNTYPVIKSSEKAVQVADAFGNLWWCPRSIATLKEEFQPSWHSACNLLNNAYDLAKVFSAINNTSLLEEIANAVRMEMID